MDFSKLSQNVQKGNARMTNKLVQEALADGVEASDILNHGLIPALNEIGVKFKNNEIYVPEMLLAGKAMTAGIKVLEPLLSLTGAKPIGTAVIGTVKGDIHDIGKNLVKITLRGIGIEVYDLGVDVSSQEFIDKAEEVNADLVCLSALLTTTMPAIGEVIKEFKKAGIKDKYIFMIGGAPVTSNFAKRINADYYTADAASAARLAEKILLEKRNS
ncbi:corrinoid protein [Intestinibacter bartlettii]|uniref:Corrinoid protein n=1 Tax=Intestinibacter bartlettii TaxID=261299 RepID=A0ABS6DWB4_9FIRM|nr:corrinoid protein [Intestinibacter bartlettii]MBU5336131.1 corrinoid protein [Intestinibacter bartlettii]MDO5010194.1 corrinoid protein [Intestinibacter bartlettii]